MSARKAEFWWASIHGADPEPVEKATHDGRPCVYTLGCADPFYLDDDPCPVLLIDSDGEADGDFGEAEPMYRPPHPDKIAAERAAMNAARNRGHKTYKFEGQRIPVPHGWRGPR